MSLGAVCVQRRGTATVFSGVERRLGKAKYTEIIISTLKMPVNHISLSTLLYYSAHAITSQEQLFVTFNE